MMTPDAPGKGQNGADLNNTIQHTDINFDSILSQVKNAPGKDFKGFDIAAKIFSLDYKGLPLERRREIYERVRNERALEGSPFQTKSGFQILPFQYTQVNPAWAIVGDELWITHPLTHCKKFLIKVEGRVEEIKKEVQENFIITSERDAFLLDEAEFNKRHLSAQMPSGLIESRWSIASIIQFLGGEVADDPYEIFKRVESEWRYYLDIDNIPGGYTVSALWDIYTYFYPLFYHTPYKWYNGKTESAKSKNGKLDALMAFNALVTTDATGPNIFRYIQETGGTLIIDEFEKSTQAFMGSEKQADLESIIASGFEKNGRVMRLELENRKQVRRYYSVFGPKVICGIANISEVLKNRSLVFPMLRTIDRKKSRREPNPEDKKWQEIRDLLYTLTMNYWQEISQIAQSASVENRLDLSERDYDKAFPILAVAQFFANHAGNEGKKILSEVWRFFKFQIKKQNEAQLDTFDFVILDAIESLTKAQTPLTGAPNDSDIIELKLSDVAELVMVNSGLDPLRINKTAYGKKVRAEMEKIGVADNFRNAQHNMLVFQTSVASVKTARLRYLGENEETHDNLDNLNNNNDYHSIVKNTLTDNLSLTYVQNQENTAKVSEVIESDKLVRDTDRENKLTFIDEEVALIAYREQRIPLAKIQDKWHNFGCPTVDKLRNSATKLATVDYSLIRLENDVVEWIGERWVD